MDKEEKLSIANLSSDLDIFSIEEEKVKATEDPLYSNFPRWSSRTKCFQAYVCLVMSFMNILEFCETTGNYGLAGLIPYLIFKIMIGAPAVLVEIFLGRYIMNNVAHTWGMCPFGRGITFNSLGISCLVTVFNYVILAYLLKYLVACFHGFIPWENCEGTWAEINCYDHGNNMSAFLKCLLYHPPEFCRNLTWESSSRQFWQNFATNSERLGVLMWSFMFLAIGIIIVVTINFKGIRSCEKMFLILVYVPLTLASVIAFATFLIPGSAVGLKRIWFTDLSLLLDLKLWVRGFENSILSLYLSFSALNFISTHGGFLDDILIDLLVVLFSNIFCCILIGAPILSIIATVKDPLYFQNLPIQKIFTDKVDVFISMSEALLQYPYPSILWALMFYIEMSLILIGTQVILVVMICEAVMGLFKYFKSFFYVCSTFGVICFFLCTPFIFDSSYYIYPIPTIVITNIFLSVITLEVLYGIQRFNDDFYFMMGYPLPFFCRFGWFITMFLCVIVLGLKIAYKIKNEPITELVYISLALPISVYFITALYAIFRAFKNGKTANAFLPNPEWGPDNTLLKKSRIIFNSRAVTKEFMYRQELYKKPFMKPFDFTEQNIVQLI